MKLLNEALLKRFAEVGRQDEKDDPLVIAMFFNPEGTGIWYATEYDPERQEFFGYALILDGEWGYFSLEELESFRGHHGIRIVRDPYWHEKPASIAIPGFTGFDE